MKKKRTKTVDGIFLAVCLIISALCLIYIYHMCDNGAYYYSTEHLINEEVFTLMDEDESVINDHITMQKIDGKKLYKDYVHDNFSDTNFAYIVYENGEIVDSNTVKSEEFDEKYNMYTCIVSYGKKDVVTGKQTFTGKDAKKQVDEFIAEETGKSSLNLDSPKEEYENTVDKCKIYVEEMHLLKDYPKQDHYIREIKSSKILYAFRYPAFIILAAGVIGSIFFFISILKSAGKRNEAGELIPSAMEKIPFDLYLLIVFGIDLLAVQMLENAYSSTAIFTAIAVCILAFCFTLRFLSSIAIRKKMKNFWKNTCIYRLSVLTWKGIQCVGRNLPFIWKGVLLIAVVYVGELLIVIRLWYMNSYDYYDYYYDYSDSIMPAILALWIIEKVILLPVLLAGLVNMNTIRKGGEELAEGKLTAQINTKYMFPAFAGHARNLNRVQEGLSKAVDEKIKSEHFKTELITNVSHDIKTPLTSIINYVDLIEKEDIQDKKLNEYIEVLDRQSHRLKKLIEDLIEASKASTGNLKVNWQTCQVDVLLTQTIGEFKEKLEAANLDLILKKEAENISIKADGRHLWRVFDNLLQNIYKYAQPGTRVYLNLEQKDKKAIIIFRNTSRYPLNISSEELMERFVRGDASRNTEGTGLGLSITRNLTELMDGKFSLDVDGDLFKVTLEFDEIINKNMDESTEI